MAKRKPMEGIVEAACCVCGKKVYRLRERDAAYCSVACRMKAYRERKASTPEPSPSPVPVAPVKKNLGPTSVWEIAPDIFLHDNEPCSGPFPPGYPKRVA